MVTRQETGGTRDARFSEYVVPEVPVMLRVARRFTGNLHDAEDLVQETLIRAYRGLDGFDGRHPRAWLFTILRNTHRNMNRRARPRVIEDPEVLSRVPARGADGRSGAEEQVLEAILDPDLVEALRALPANAREIVLLVDVDGLSYEEAAHALDVPTGTVMSRLHRARKRLRKRLGSISAFFAPG